MVTKCLVLLIFISTLSSHSATYVREKNPQTGLGRFWNRQYSSASGLQCQFPRLAHGRTRARMRSKMVKFSCFPTYELVGNRYATCVDGEWDEPPPVCVRSGCQVPTKMENGVVLRNRNDAWLAFFCMPGFRLQGAPVVYCDGARWNSSMPACVDGNASPPLSCDFESADLCGWKQDETHDFDWRRLNGKTPSSFLNTGPSHDHTLGEGNFGYYMYIESTSRDENNTARLLSPIYNASLAKDGCFSFYYHMYGQSIGGLRVYQKPDNLSLTDLLAMPAAARRRYTLFERWGDQGDYWLQDMARLNDFGDDFQIVLEGIRGRSFTSDIAVDDVSLLRGGNCSEPAAPSEPSYPGFSCAGQCGARAGAGGAGGAGGAACGCSADCYLTGECCPDFFELCMFSSDGTTDNEVFDAQPQTQKLIGTTQTTTTEPSTTAPPPTTSTTPKPSTTTPVPTTTTTAKPSTTTKRVVSTTKLTTKVIPKIVIKSTTPMYNATGVLQKDNKTTTVLTSTSTVRTTTKGVIRTTNRPQTTTLKATTYNHGVSRTIENHNQYHQLVEEAKNRRLDGENEAKPVKSSSAATTLIILLVVLVSATAAAALVRRRRGRARAAGGEVRYLTAHEDED